MKFIKVLHRILIKKTYPTLSIYRISLFLFGEWLEGGNVNFLTPSFKEQYFSDIATLVHKTNMYDYLVNTRKNIGLDPVEFSITSDFCESDVEQYEQTFEVLSELEEKRIEVFRDFIVDLKPLLRKGIVESLKYSSDLQISVKNYLQFILC